MASTSIKSLKQEIEQIAASYEAGFAGQSRATRDLDALAGLIRRTREVVTQLEKLPAADERNSLLEDARNRLGVYENEQGAIKDAKAAGPEFAEFSRLAGFANFVFARYFRHFAGKDRASRDLGMLKEMIDELAAIRQRMSVILVVKPNDSFRRDGEVVTNSVTMYEQELREVTKAQTDGSVEEQASKLANLANAQFELYRIHFVGQPRLTRRPAMLQRIIDNLRRVRSGMQGLRATGETAKTNRDNIGIVDSNLRLYETELGEIRKARQATQLRDIMGHLGGAANVVFEEYRSKYAGQDRRKVSLDALSVMCDKLGEIARQMADLGRTEHNDANEDNLGIVMEQLADYDQEYRAILKAQQPANPAQG